MRRAILVLLSLSMVFLSAPAIAATHLLGPEPYLELADSPFSAVVFTEHWFEDFEDHSLDLANVSLICVSGTITSASFPLSAVDSVDGDDGDPGNDQCSDCDSWWANGPAGVQIIFQENSSGELPNHAGIVWTDGAGLVSFQVYDHNGDLAGTIGPVDIADGSTHGTTAEDRFFGAIDHLGISSIHIWNSSGGIEIDHIQYGHAENVLPVCDAGGPYMGNPGEGIQFDGSGSFDQDGAIESYEWDFGDGETGSGVMPVHAYASGGSYIVELCVTDNAGDTVCCKPDPVHALPTLERSWGWLKSRYRNANR